MRANEGRLRKPYDSNTVHSPAIAASVAQRAAVLTIACTNGIGTPSASARPFEYTNSNE